MGVMAVVVALDLWWHRHLLQVVSWPNDVPLHRSMVGWAAGRWFDGQWPATGWFPYLSGGLPQFQHYQSLPHALTGLLAVPIGAAEATHLVLWLLVGTWPIAVFIGARALGLGVRPAALAAVIAPLARSATGYGFESFSYLWLGNGLWSQAWGMWTAPLALGWSARAIRTGAGMGRAVAAMAATTLFHLPTAWFAYLALGLWVLVAPGSWRVRLPRGMGIGVLGLLASAWMLVPFHLDRWAINHSSFDGEGSFTDSFGWRQVGAWLGRGDVFDAGRLPVLSVLASAGALWALRRWRRAVPGAREAVAVTVLALVLFVGRDPFGPLIDLLPAGGEVFLHRYVAFVQLGFALCAAMAADAAIGATDAKVARRGWGRAGPRLAIVAGAALVLLPGVHQIGGLLADDRAWVERQATADGLDGADAAHLVSLAAGRGDGRVTMGNTAGGGRATMIGGVSGAVWLGQLPVDQVGYTLRVSALAADLEVARDEASAVELDALGVRYVVATTGSPPPSGAWLLARRGRFALWEVAGDGPVQVAEVVGPPVAASSSSLLADLRPEVLDRAALGRRTVVVDLDGRSPLPTDRGAPESDDELPGTVLDEDRDLEAGRVRAVVDVRRPALVVVQANWHPRWRATVDGRPVDVAMGLPTWLAVPVEPGTHEVELVYEGWRWSRPLAVASVVPVLVGRRWSRRGADS